jgi:hypothetical protein
MVRDPWFEGAAVWFSTIASVCAAVRGLLVDHLSPSSAERWILPLLIIATFFVIINSFYVIDVRVLPRGAERDAWLRRLAVGVFDARVRPPGTNAPGSARS